MCEVCALCLGGALFCVTEPCSVLRVQLVTKCVGQHGKEQQIFGDSRWAHGEFQFIVQFLINLF